MPLRVGITGGIGAGKTLVAGMFEMLGVPVYNADSRARQLMRNDQEVIRAVKELLGDSAYHPDGSIDNKYIAGIVFRDSDKLEALNGIVHPAVGRDFVDWSDRHTERPYVLKEAALIFEAGLEKDLDAVLLVYAPEEIRIERVINRDDTSEEEVRRRMDNQWPDSKKVPKADFIIVNDGNKPLIRQVMEVHDVLCSLSKTTKDSLTA